MPWLPLPIPATHRLSVCVSVCLSVSICLCFCLFNFCLQYVSLHRIPSFKRVNTKRPSRKGKTLLPGDKSIHGARNSLESNQVIQEWSWSPQAQPRKDSHKSQHQHRPEPDPNRELIQESGRDFKTNKEVKEETKANATEMSKSCRKSGWTDSTCAPQQQLATVEGCRHEGLSGWPGCNLSKWERPEDEGWIKGRQVWSAKFKILTIIQREGADNRT